MKIYVIEVMTLGGLYPTTKVSQEAYNSYELAKEFCSSRSDNPMQIDDYNWKSDQYKYSILVLPLRISVTKWRVIDTSCDEVG